MASIPELARPDFSNIPADAIKELHRQGEICLQSTMQLALAADQRATTLTGIMGAGAVALLAATATMISSAHPSAALIGTGAGTATLLFVGALFCAWAAQPLDFFVAGYEPRRMAPAARDETWILRYATEDMQIRIDSNRASLVHASRLLTWGRSIALLAVPLGITIFFAISLVVSHHFFGMGHLGPAAAVVGAQGAGGLAAKAAAKGLVRSAKPAD